ncbi:NYN domain-containing protein [Patescibacteria group bacterium]|nr:NYN domain-containing protein [Patescibacteria group bacterium]
MKKNLNNFAYIDGSNLHKGVKNLGWALDYQRFRVWLRDKYGVDTAYLFIGLVPANKEIYTKLQESGYVLIYKEITYDGGGRVKGNCDADLVLKAARDFYEGRLEKAILVSSDGDYACLVSFLKEKGVFHSLISPSNKCSFLLRKLNIPIVYLDMIKKKVMKHS